MAFGEFSKEDIEDFAGDFGRLVDIIVAIIYDFGLDDRDDIGGLTFGGVFGKNLAVFSDSGIGGGENMPSCIEMDFEGGTPFGETETHLVVFGEAGIEILETFSVGLKGVGEEF